MRDFRLYLILDSDICGKNIITIAEKAARGGIDIVQLRAKHSSVKYILSVLPKLKSLFFRYKIPLIINDRIDLALAVQADGVHLGQDDLPIKLARKLLGNRKIIGISCHNFNQAELAQGQGADYLSLGPIFATATKPEYKPVGVRLIKQALGKIRIPFVAIGGISHGNIKEIINSGAERIAVCRAICEAKDVVGATKELKSILENDPTRTVKK